MPTYATPGVYFETTDQSSQGISAVRTDIAAFLGVAQKGPVHRPTAVNSWEQFQSTFGSYLPNSYMAYCAQAFFQNGGQTLYGVRIAAPAVITTTDLTAVQTPDGSASILLSSAGFAPGALATAQQTATGVAVGAQPADRASSVVNTVSGFAQGSLVKITQSVPAAVQAFRTVKAVNAAANTLLWNAPLDAAFVLSQPIQLASFHHKDLLVQTLGSGSNTVNWVGTLLPEFNVMQPIQVSSGAAGAHGTLFDADGNPTIGIEAQTPGVWGDALAVLITQASPAAATTSSQPQPASGSASLLSSIVGFQIGSLVKTYQASVAPQYRIVTGRDASMNLLLWDSPLTAPLNLAQPISFETIEFTLSVYLNGMEQEIFSGLSLNSQNAKYVESAINSNTSRFIVAKDLSSPAPNPDRLPDPGAPQLKEGVLALWGGRDGIAALTAMDFMGDPSSDSKWGLRTLEDVDEVSMVCAADILIEPSPAVAYAPLPPVLPNPCLRCAPPTSAQQPVGLPVEAAPHFSLDDVYHVQQAIIAHCEAMQYRIAILDPPDFGYPRQQINLGEVQSWRNRFDSSYAALYFPWLLVVDPLQPRNAIVRRIPPSGHAAGVCAHTDVTVGVHKAPANVELQWAQDVTAEVTAAMQGFLNPLGVNCIRAFRGRGLRIYGARTLSSESSWQFVNVRRLMCMIEHALEIALQWAVFEPNDFYVWHKIVRAATTFLNALWQKGALSGNKAADAFFVECDQLTNPPAATSAGKLTAIIGVAPTQPAEFVVFRIGRTEDTLEVQEQQS